MGSACLKFCARLIRVGCQNSFTALTRGDTIIGAGLIDHLLQ